MREWLYYYFIFILNLSEGLGQYEPVHMCVASVMWVVILAGGMCMCVWRCNGMYPTPVCVYLISTGMYPTPVCVPY